MAPRRIGVISDTYGLLRTEALDALAGVEQIIHVNLPISLALLEIEGRSVAAQIVKIAPAVGELA